MFLEKLKPAKPKANKVNDTGSEIKTAGAELIAPIASISAPAEGKPLCCKLRSVSLTKLYCSFKTTPKPINVSISIPEVAPLISPTFSQLLPLVLISIRVPLLLELFQKPINLNLNSPML